MGSTPLHYRYLVIDSIVFIIRLLFLALQIPGFNNPDAPPVSDGPQMLSLMSEVTGGRCQAVSSMKALFSVIEGIIARLQPGVVVSFETVLPLPASAPVIPPSLHKLLFVRTTQPGSWPIPEAFLPDPSFTQLVRFLFSSNASVHRRLLAPS